MIKRGIPYWMDSVFQFDVSVPEPFATDIVGLLSFVIELESNATTLGPTGVKSRDRQLSRSSVRYFLP